MSDDDPPPPKVNTALIIVIVIIWLALFIWALVLTIKWGTTKQIPNWAIICSIVFMVLGMPFFSLLFIYIGYFQLKNS